MKGFGGRLRARAKELGLSNSEVARRLGLRQARYSNYVNDDREPDLSTLVRICQTLHISADQLLGIAAPAENESSTDQAIQRVSAVVQTLGPSTVEMVAVMLEAIAEFEQRSGKK